MTESFSFPFFFFCILLLQSGRHSLNSLYKHIRPAVAAIYRKHSLQTWSKGRRKTSSFPCFYNPWLVFFCYPQNWWNQFQEISLRELNWVSKKLSNLFLLRSEKLFLAVLHVNETSPSTFLKIVGTFFFLSSPKLFLPPFLLSLPAWRACLARRQPAIYYFGFEFGKSNTMWKPHLLSVSPFLQQEAFEFLYLSDCQAIAITPAALQEIPFLLLLQVIYCTAVLTYTPVYTQ